MFGGNVMRTNATLLAGVLLFAVPAAAAPNPCATPQHRQFDFWVGKWEVFSKSDPKMTVIAHSLIEKLYDGCAIRENWMPLNRAGGGSLNSYIPAKKSWRQFWTDAQGSVGEFSGRWNGKAMVIEGPWPQPGHPEQHTRIVYTPLADGTVEQSGETSDDKGKSWQPSFDLIYRKP
jgi:hypothetical protein